MSAFFKHTRILLCILLLVGTFVHFYNLNWGAPYYFHPDERNIASSVSQLRFPNQMNPKFFAYGSLPIYTIYGVGVIQNSIKSCTSNISSCFSLSDAVFSVKFEQAIIISRALSAVLATLLILLVYRLSEMVGTKKIGLLAAFFTTFSVGIIQFSHFGTFEMWLTFFTTLLVYVSIKLLQKKRLLYYMQASSILGMLVAIKISSLALLPIPLVAFFLSHYPHPTQKRLTYLLIQSTRTVLAAMVLLFIAGCIFFSTNPYIVWDYEGFRGGMKYETSVALGTLPVFYTQTFFETIPILYQFLYVYPFLLNPLLTFFFIISCIYLVMVTYKTKNKQFFLVYFTFTILFLSQSMVFVKWTRYMVPTLPYIYIIISICIAELFTKYKHMRTALQATFGILVITCLLFSLSYTVTVLAKPDTRITAKEWAATRLEANFPAISEIYDLGIVPFNGISNNITLCDFYNYEQNLSICNGQLLSELLQRTDIIIIPSQRIMQSRLQNTNRYPRGSTYYNELLNGKLGYTKVYETPCDIWCKILYLNDPLFSFEQTASVFDRPMVMIFRKN